MTFILMWNPDISSTTLTDWRYWMQHFPFITPNWSIWDHDKGEWYDDFYMVKVGSGKTGIVARGIFTSMPYKGDDWSGKGRDVYYRDLRILNIVDPEDGPMISTAELENKIPGFGWESGHSGRLLSEEDTAKLDKIWKKFRNQNAAFFDEQDEFSNYVVEPSALKRVKNGNLWKEIHDWCEDDYSLFSEAATHDCVNFSFAADYHKGTFKLSVWFDIDSVLNITCSVITRLKIENDNVCGWDSDFSLSESGPEFLHLRANGIEIWCKDIRFTRGKDTKCEYLPMHL